MEISEVKSASSGVSSHEKDLSQCVKVAVNVRPLITPELLIGCTDCISVVPGEPQVQIGSHAFTFDYVYGGSQSLSSSSIFNDCVAPLVDALFHGYNATVLAYGQTGSGKTYTMGTNYNGEEHNGGIIPKVMETIFSRLEATKDSTEFLIRVSFIEIFKEEVFDLLDSNPSAISRGEGAGKPAIPARVPIQIRETVNGGITLAGVMEAEVRTKEEMASYLSRGSLSRATGSTNMNSQSSRSHAIFTISMEQKRISRDDAGDDILCAKLHLVDLAGSERAKRTGADGMRFKEGIHINKGLLALGNVISALGDEKKRKEGGHVPYRDSKLTRLLQDSLGGNSKTVMIACVSPADTNAEETLNTLKYANRARNIQNKAVINRDPMTAQMQKMRSQIEQLQAELLFSRGDSAPFEELQILKQKVSLLEASNAELQRELQERRITCEQLAQRAVEAQVEKDKLILKIESARHGKSWDEIDSNAEQDCGLVKNYVSKIQQLEGELLRLQSLNSSKLNGFVDCLDSDDESLRSKNAYFASLHEFSSICDTKEEDISGESENDEKELEHSSLQEKLDMELKELDKKLEEKEAEMKRFSNVDTSVLKHHYEKKVNDLEREKRALQKEIEELSHNLQNISSSSDDGAKKLKHDYLQKLNFLEAQVAELKKKQDAQAQLLRQKQKSDEAAKRLQDEIQRIKSQKVQLQHKIKQESEQFRLWKASREKEVLQLKKEGRRNEYEMHKLLALNQRQKMVLQRKTEEASMATKRLKELLESRKASSRDSGLGNGPGIQALMQAIEHELEVTVRVHEVRAEYERQMEERARMAKEVAKLKEEAELLRRKNLSNCPETMSPGARNSRIFSLENMLATSSSTLVSMASQLSEAEERERVFSGRGRWNQVRSLAEAKNIMNYLFNLASSSRCLLWDKEVDCRDKSLEIKDLKEKVVKLGTFVRHLELQKAELIYEIRSLKLASNNCSMEDAPHSGGSDQSNGGHNYQLRKSLKGPRNSMALVEDMDMSESEHSDVDGVDDDADEDWQNACCSCSKSSQCKTTKCECRAVQGLCGTSCGCTPAKCSNRGAVLTSELDELPQSEIVDGTGNGLVTDENDEKRQILATQGAMLLQSALAEKPSSEANDDGGPRRKALSDIGNTRAKSNAPKPNPRKKWKKSSIQLIPVVAPPTASQPENNDASKKDENSTVEVDIPLRLPRAMRLPASQPENNDASKKDENSTVEVDIPLRLPRAMRLPASNTNNFLRERNSGQSNESMVSKENDTRAPTSPVKQARTSDEKENHGI